METRALAVILLVVLAGSVVIYFSQFWPKPLNILSVDKIYIAPETGQENPTTHEWEGSFWVIELTVDPRTDITGIKFDATGVTTDSGFSLPLGEQKIGDKTLKPTSKVKISVYLSGKPYYEVAVDGTLRQVVPKAFSSCIEYEKGVGEPVPTYSYYEDVGSQGETILALWVKNPDGKPVVAPVTVIAGDKEYQDTTDSSGYVDFSLGTYQGKVTIDVTPGFTSLYQGATFTKTVQEGTNTFHLTLEYNWMLFIAILAFILILIVVIVIAMRKRE